MLSLYRRSLDSYKEKTARMRATMPNIELTYSKIPNKRTTTKVQCSGLQWPSLIQYFSRMLQKSKNSSKIGSIIHSFILVFCKIGKLPIRRENL